MLGLQGKYQVVATKLGREVCFDVTIYTHELLEGERLSAETQCQDPFNHLLQFIVRNATDEKDIRSQMNAQLAYRGFIPRRFRLRSADDALGRSRWNPWEEIDNPPPLG